MLKKVFSMVIACVVLSCTVSTVFASSSAADKWTKDKKVSMSQTEIKRWNNKIRENKTGVMDLSKAPKTLKGSYIKKKITQYSITCPYTKRGYATSSVKAFYNGLRNLSALQDSKTVKMKYALVSAPVNLRQYPTDDWMHTRQGSTLDRFQESMLHIGQGVYLMHFSKNRQWAFVQSKNCAGWVKTGALALCSKEQMVDYTESSASYIINRKTTGTLAGKKRTLLTGTKLAANKEGEAVIPCRTKDGKLVLKQEKLSSRFSARKGYASFTRNRLIKQAYTFVGTKYGWGMSNYLQDCSSMTGSVYSVFGIDMPRDTSHMCRAKGQISLKGKSNAEKIRIIRKQKAGDLIFYKGHVMMYLGYKNGKVYILHSREPKCAVEPIPDWRLKNATGILSVEAFK